MAYIKPQSCQGCPFYHKSKYITPDYVVPGSEVAILAQNPGENEELGKIVVGSYWSNGKKQETYETTTPQPLIGATGQWLQKDFWPLTKISYDQVSRLNVLKCRPHNSNDLPTIGSNKTVNGIKVTELKEAIAHCTQTYLRFPDTVQHIMAMGEISLYALTGEELLHYKKGFNDVDDTTGKDEEANSTISEWRGWCLGVDLDKKTVLGLHEYYYPIAGSPLWPRLVNVFPVLHLASLYRSDKLYHATLLDFIRFGKLVTGQWPEKLPSIKINELPKTLPPVIGFDTEYTKDNLLKMWSLADVQRNVYVIDGDYHQGLEILNNEFARQKIDIITQNGLVDLPHFHQLFPAVTGIKLEDCMLAHATLWPGERNSLDYMLSKYGTYNRHKHLRQSHNKDTSYLYAGLDADSTLNVAWKSLIKEFKQDPQSWAEYKLRRQPLLYPISKFQARGVEVWQERVELLIQILDKQVEDLFTEAKEITENPDFNLRSGTQLKDALYKGIFKAEPKPKVSKKKKSE